MREHTEGKQILKRERLVTGIFLLILLFLQLFLHTGWGDDLWFAEESSPLGEYLSARYKGWTSRLLIETGLKLLAAAPDWVWRSVNIMIVLLLVWIVADLFGIEKDNTKLQAKIFFFALMWVVPMMCVREVGWMATTLNYLWPLTLGLVAARPIKHWVREEKCPAWEYAVCPLCLLCGANAEQGAALLFGGYLLFGAYMLYNKKRIPGFYFVLLFLVVASILFILTTPGNANRVAQETDRWFPEFADMGIWQKLLMGFIDTASYYVAAGGSGRINYLFGLLTGILLAGMWHKRKERRFAVKVMISFLPLLFFWIAGKAGTFLLVNRGSRHSGWYIIGLFGLNRCLPTGAGAFEFLGWIPYSMDMVLLQAGVYLVLLICVMLTIYFLHGRSFETLFELVILGAGLLSRLIIGFSPSLYASGERTALYCNAAILVVCLRNLQFYWKGSAGKWERVVLAAYIFGMIGANLW